MTKKEYTALIELVEAKIDEKISDAFGRDSLSERIRFRELEKDFLSVKEKGDEN